MILNVKVRGQSLAHGQSWSLNMFTIRKQSCYMSYH